MPIDWSKLRPYKGTKHKSFEQLCYQIAVRFYDGKGRFTAIDDSGGGDGVEFYLTRPDGTEWGWQAKYYDHNPRLQVGGRKEQILTSLRRALDVHPQMTRWFLCVPMNFTPAEEVWVSHVLPNHIPKERSVNIIPWTETFLHEKMSLPLYSGLRSYFFGELELSQDWFRKTFETAFATVKNKFDEFLYVTNGHFEDLFLNPLLCNNKFLNSRLLPFLQDAEEQYEVAKEEVRSLEAASDLTESFWEECIRLGKDINEQIAALLPLLTDRMHFVTPNRIGQLAETDYRREIIILINQANEYSRYVKNETHVGTFMEPRHYERPFVERVRQLRHLDNTYDRIIDAMRNLIPHSALPNGRQVGHYLGNGGDGKTNLAVSLAREYLANGHPAIFIPALWFTSDLPLSEQVLSLLHIPKAYTFHDFLAVLNEAGNIHDTRIPIILDGLNEAAGQDGYFNRIIPTSLPLLEQAITQHSHLVLITTCRPSYKPEIWKEAAQEDERFHYIYGFTDHSDKKKLVNTYFHHYKIEADLSFLSLAPFSKPLYLKIYCESLNRLRQKPVPAKLGFDSVYPVFDLFVSQCDEAINERIKKTGRWFPGGNNRNIASRVLRQIAGQLWRNHDRVFSFDELWLLADGAQQPPYKDSVTKALLDEELLFIRDWHKQGDSVFLTYDLLAGYLIADYLVQETSRVEELLTEENRELLIGADFEKRHPNHEDIIAGICGLLPMRKGIYLHDLLTSAGDTGFIEGSLVARSVETMLTLSPELIPAKQILLVAELAGRPDQLISLLISAEVVWFLPEHPFNFTFWSECLRGLAMHERDLTWGEYLRSREPYFVENIVTELKGLLATPALLPQQIERIGLVITFLTWTFTSTNGELKKQAAEGIYRFGLRYPDRFVAHFYRALSGGDIGVSEWMNSVLYHVLSAVTGTSPDRYKELFVELALFLEREFFKETGAHATSHLLIRGSAFDSLALLTEVYSDLNLNLSDIRSRFKILGITRWEKAEDRNRNEYRDGNSLIDYHFNKEKMPYISEGKGSEYDDTPYYRGVQAKLRWRAYQLGYRFERFGTIDREITNTRHRNNDYDKAMERLADKYIGIAFFEYCGFLEAKGRLQDFRRFGYARAFEPTYAPVPEASAPVSDQLAEEFAMPSFIDTSVSLAEWGSDDQVPDVKEYLLRTIAGEGQSQWVLLDGIIRQHRSEYERQIFIRLDIVFIKSRDRKKARTAFTRATRLGWSNSKPHSENVHASEIPGGHIIPYNEFVKWEYADGMRRIEKTYATKALYRAGKELDRADADSLWNDITRRLGYLFYPREWPEGSPIAVIRSHNSSPLSKLEKTVEKALEEQDIEVREQIVRRTEEVPVNKSISVFVPVRILKQKAYLCKNIIETSQLTSRAGTTDLYDTAGQLASFTYSSERDDFDNEAFTYIRKNVLDDYLHDNDLVMYILIWGERDYYPIDGNWGNTTARIHDRRQSKIYEAVEYEIG